MGVWRAPLQVPAHDDDDGRARRLHGGGGVDRVLLRVVHVNIHRGHVDGRFQGVEVIQSARHDAVAFRHIEHIAHARRGQTNQNAAHHAYFFLIVEHAAVGHKAADVFA